MRLSAPNGDGEAPTMARTLIIDGDAETEPLLRDYFQRLGGNLIEACAFAKSSEEALSILRSGVEFDIALIAIDDEETAGLSLFHKIEDQKLRIPRVALTRGEDLRLIRDAMVQGAMDFLIKPIPFGDFAATLERTIETVERRRRNWQERAAFSALKREIDIAADIQQRILPTDFPVSEGYQIAADMRAANVMGGDFYDVFPIDGGRTAIVVADVSGKGVPAAFYMAVARTLIRSAAIVAAGPADCLGQVNELLCGHHIPGMFVSVFYAVLDSGSNRVEYANGGHQLPFKGRPGQTPMPLAGGDGVVLGILGDQDYSESVTEMESGEFLYVFTDGVTEAFNAEREAFSEERLARCLDLDGEPDANQILERVRNAVASFVADADQHDDVTSLVVKRL